MLLEFRISNFKSFVDEMTFSLVPAPKQKGLDYSVLQERVGSKAYKGLCSAVIYGPNASGKTNIVGAMEVFKLIILRGHIRNESNKNSPNTAADTLELIPNSSQEKKTPVFFAIKFIEQGVLFEYQIKLDLGLFLKSTYKRKILSEVLFVNEKKIFERDDILKLDEISTVKKYLNKGLAGNLSSAVSLAEGSLNGEELFLVNGFKNIFSAELASMIASWMDTKFLPIYRADTIHHAKLFSEPQRQSVHIEESINSAAKLFGISSNDLGYIVQENEVEGKLSSLFKHKDSGIAIPAEIYESYGTIRFINLFPIILTTLLQGGTLIVDEFDASIHPMALMSIINIFHNDAINTRNAQLIFNTHNPIFLNSNLYRRDEIKFVERDEATQGSSLYSLSDFGTSGEKAARKHDDYMKKYFISQYGAIKDIDFTPIFESLVLADEVK